jgi:bacterioferritin-associated ferredoxin
VIDTDTIEAVIVDALKRAPAGTITPELVYERCGAVPSCGTCRELIGLIIEEVTTELSQKA